MLATIELNDQALFKTHKIEHIAIEWMLPAELDASELAAPQALPQTSFGVGCILSQVAPKLSVVNGTVSLAFHVFMLPHPHPDPPLEGEGSIQWKSNHQPLLLKICSRGYASGLMLRVMPPYCHAWSVRHLKAIRVQALMCAAGRKRRNSLPPA
ncbi:protein of unknown function [Georgfuchsia toluolica]|uniref:Uncharacterized protein n=1 Tax=Georgfuchsia toluolica TaxID=424218 RepID=A0A916J479_9PROT|nr:protein of unknown function [Georgfuchsia toluolica]